MDNKTRIKKIIAVLRKNYPSTRTILKHTNSYELLIATLLSAQCTDKRVNMVTPIIFKKYKGPEGFSKAKQSVLEEEIRSTGFFRNKAKNIIALSKMLVRDYGGNVPDSMNELVKLPGVARKTANIILSYCFKKAEGIAVDTHVARLSKRLGLTKEINPNKIEIDLMNLIPKKDWLDFNSLLVDHGRAVCNAKKPLCNICKLNKICLYAKNSGHSSK
ncbi:MAG: endonuclease III [Elusimicrobiota bacterium]